MIDDTRCALFRSLDSSSSARSLALVVSIFNLCSQLLTQTETSIAFLPFRAYLSRAKILKQNALSFCNESVNNLISHRVFNTKCNNNCVDVCASVQVRENRWFRITNEFQNFQGNDKKVWLIFCFRRKFWKQNILSRLETDKRDFFHQFLDWSHQATNWPTAEPKLMFWSVMGHS